LKTLDFLILPANFFGFFLNKSIFILALSIVDLKKNFQNENGRGGCHFGPMAVSKSLKSSTVAGLTRFSDRVSFVLVRN